MGIGRLYAWPFDALVALAWHRGVSVSLPTSPRVVVAFHEAVLGGATRSIVRLVPLLERLGWEFSFWVPKPSELHDDLAGRGWDVDGAPRSIEYSFRAWRLPPGAPRRVLSTPDYLRTYRDFLESRRPTLVHANSILTLAEALVARRFGVPALLHSHEMLPLDPRGRMLRRVAWRYLDEIVAVSGPCAERLAHARRLPRIVHEASPVPAQAVSLRRRPRPFTVGTVAVVSQRKGSDLFVEAAQLLLSRNGSSRDYRFEMVGPPSDLLDRRWAETVLARASESGIRHDGAADVFERLRAWDAFVLPSRSDPFPLSMLEAMASGLPVIGTRVDGIVEQLANGCGILIDGDDPRALADAIAALAEQPLRARKAMGAAARERVLENFTLDHQAAQMHETYESVLSSARGVKALIKTYVALPEA